MIRKIVHIDEEKCNGCGSCGGLDMAAKKAIQMSGKVLPPQIVTISIDGKVLDR